MEDTEHTLVESYPKHTSKTAAGRRFLVKQGAGLIKLIAGNLQLEPPKPGPEQRVWRKEHPLVGQVFEEKMAVGGRGDTTVYTGIITHV